MNTSTDHTEPGPSDRDILAGEYVLGVLSADERRSAQHRAEVDPVFAQELAAWESHLMPLIDEISPVPPPLALWPRILFKVGLVADEGTARTSRLAGPTALWQTASAWRWLAGASLATAAACLIALLQATGPAPPDPSANALMVAKMVRDDGHALFLASVDARTGAMIVQPTTVEIPEGSVPELWLIPPGDSPHSLGILDPGKANSLTVPKNLIGALGPHALVAVSIEPPGGGPGGKPSGPIIAKGEISLL